MIVQKVFCVVFCLLCLNCNDGSQIDNFDFLQEDSQLELLTLPGQEFSPSLKQNLLNNLRLRKKAVKLVVLYSSLNINFKDVEIEGVVFVDQHSQCEFYRLQALKDGVINEEQLHEYRKSKLFPAYKVLEKNKEFIGDGICE